MTTTTNRQRLIAKALTALVPLAPYADAERIRQMAAARDMRELPPSIAIWLSTITYVRHEHSSYDALLNEGYDRDSARFFVVDEINATLTKWRATRFLEPDSDE